MTTRPGAADRARAVADLLLACCAGAGLATLVHALAWPAHAGFEFLDVKLLLIGAGALPAGALAGGLAVMIAAARARLRGADSAAAEHRLLAAAFFTALLAGLGALAGAWAFALWGQHTGLRVGALAGALLGILLPLPAPPRAFTRSAGALMVLTVVLLYAGVGYRAPFEYSGVRAEVEMTKLDEAPAGARIGAGPDVLLISVDTLRADDCLSDEVPTPALDALRARSRWAEYGRAPAPSTLPSHAAMVTGRHPLDTGCYSNSGLLAAEAGDTLAEVFRDAGWRAAGVASNAVLNQATGFTRGFEAFTNLAEVDPAFTFLRTLGRSCRRMSPISFFVNDADAWRVAGALVTRRTNLPPNLEEDFLTPGATQVRDAALSYLHRLNSGAEPWFFFLHFMDLHAPYVPDPRFAGSLSAASTLPERYLVYPHASTMSASAVKRDLTSDDPAVRAAAQAGAAHLRLLYREELLAVDAALADVLAFLDAAGRPYVVLFTADHGEHFAEHGMMLHGNSVYEELLRVPFMLAGPGIAPGMFDNPPRLEDAGITLLRAAGIPVPAFGHGRDLLQPLALPGTPAIATHDNAFAVLDGAWKARFEWNCKDPREAALTLAALTHPDDEGRDFAASEPAVLAALRALAEQARANARANRAQQLTPTDRANLAALGYVFDAEGNLIER
jgi:arylsulfatase A-like enzyme